MKQIKKWITSDPKNVKFCFKMDIRKFFDSIPHDKLKAKLKKTIHDKRFISVLFTLIDVVDIGLPIGFYTSQWLANWYLQGLDHYIKEELGASHHIRYMDDIVIFGSNKRKLHRIHQEIEKYLLEKLGLSIKDNWQVYRFDYIRGGEHFGRCLDFMGFKFYRDHVTLRRNIMLRAARKAKKLSRKEKPSIYEIRQMLAYIGWIDHTNTYGMYCQRIKPYVDIRKFKKRISSYDRRQKQLKGAT
jgi:retron-type reverse transcriptase